MNTITIQADLRHFVGTLYTRTFGIVPIVQWCGDNTWRVSKNGITLGYIDLGTRTFTYIGTDKTVRLA